MVSLFWNFKQRRLRAGVRLIIHSVFLVMLLIGLFLPLLIVLETVPLDERDAAVLVPGGLIQALAIVCSVWIAAWLLDRRGQPLRDLGFRNWRWPHFWWGCLLGGSAMCLIFGIEWGIGWLEIESVGVSPTLAWPTLLGYQCGWLSLMVAVGYSEESLSRGYHLKNLTEGMRPLGVWTATLLATLISATFFAMLHLMNDNTSATSTLGIALAGVMLAIARITTGNLAAPVGLHIAWNFVQGPVLGFPVSGHAFQGSLIRIRQLGDETWTGGSFGPEAGWLGILAVAALAICYLGSAGIHRRATRHAAALAHYRPARPQLTSSIRSKAINE